MVVKMKDKELHLIKNPININDKLEFKATNLDLTDFELINFKNKNKIISVVPSLDTNTCLMQTKKINEKLSKLDDYQLITISRDLPFASSRICDSFKQENHLIISDYKYRDFGLKTGLTISELELLARTLIVLDKNNIVQYIDINEETTDEPNYEKLFTFLKI